MARIGYMKGPFSTVYQPFYGIGDLSDSSLRIDGAAGTGAFVLQNPDDEQYNDPGFSGFVKGSYGLRISRLRIQKSEGIRFILQHNLIQTHRPGLGDSGIWCEKIEMTTSGFDVGSRNGVFTGYYTRQQAPTPYFVYFSGLPLANLFVVGFGSRLLVGTTGWKMWLQAGPSFLPIFEGPDHDQPPDGAYTLTPFGAQQVGQNAALVVAGGEEASFWDTP